MKKLTFAFALTLSLLTGFTAVNTYSAANSENTTTNSDSRIYIKVYEDGAIWVYVYESDGTFISKTLENN